MTFPSQTPDQATKPAPDERFSHESRLARTPWWWFVTAGAVALRIYSFVDGVLAYSQLLCAVPQFYPCTPTSP